MTEDRAFAKKSITIPVDVLTDAQEFVKHGNLSAYVAEALRRQVERDKLDRLVQGYVTEHGAFTAEEMDAVAREFA